MTSFKLPFTNNTTHQSLMEQLAGLVHTIQTEGPPPSKEKIEEFIRVAYYAKKELDPAQLQAAIDAGCGEDIIEWVKRVSAGLHLFNGS